MDFVKKHIVIEKINEILDMNKLDRVIIYINSKLSDPIFLMEYMNAPNRDNAFIFDFTGGYNSKDIEYLEQSLKAADWKASVSYTSNSIRVTMNRN